MKIALIGATGRVGGFILEDCLEKHSSYSIRALYRRACKLDAFQDRIEIVEGDATQPKDLQRLLSTDVDVLISTIGSPNNDTVVVAETAMALVEVLKERKSLPRIIWMTSTGINEATEHAMMIQDLWDDMGISEDVLRDHPQILESTVIVRPTNMHPVSEEAVFSEQWREEGGTNQKYVFCKAEDPPPGKWIWRRAISAALLDLVKDSSYDGTAISLFQEGDL